MTLAPREYIAARRREISEKMQQLRSELADLERMESVLTFGQIPLPIDGPQKPTETEVHPSAPKRRQIEGGIKAAVMSVLAPAFPKALSSQEILAGLRANEVDIPRTTLSPQLSRMKRAGEVENVEGAWKATDKGLLEYVL